jgi:hypothetical protein
MAHMTLPTLLHFDAATRVKSARRMLAFVDRWRAGIEREIAAMAAEQ